MCDDDSLPTTVEHLISAVIYYILSSRRLNHQCIEEHCSLFSFSFFFFCSLFYKLVSNPLEVLFV